MQRFASTLIPLSLAVLANGNASAAETRTERITDRPSLSAMSVGDRNLFDYHRNELVSIYRDGGLPAGIQHTFEVIVSGKGDNRTYRGQTVAYFEYRDRDDVTASTKGAGYAAHFSVALREGRNHVPYDDVAGIAVGNTGGITSAKATDAIYISENPLFTRAGSSEWYSLLTMDAKADVGIQIKQRPVTGKAARFPNNSFVFFGNDTGILDLKAIGVDESNHVLLGDPAAAGVDMLAPVRRLVRPVSPVVSTRGYVVRDIDNKLTCSASCVLTLPAAATAPGRELWVRSTGGAVTSASANVVPLSGGAPATAILSGRGKWAFLYSDGTSWQTQAAN